MEQKMNNLKCPNCGADISTDEAQTTGKCPYCNSRFAAEKKPEPVNNDSYEAIQKAVRPTEPRPRINFGILLILFFFGGPLFLGYIILVEIKKRSWDLKYSGQKSKDIDFTPFDRH